MSLSPVPPYSSRTGLWVWAAAFTPADYGRIIEKNIQQKAKILQNSD
jgi:hypothetical protein